jgi:hypothetical protein
VELLAMQREITPLLSVGLIVDSEIVPKYTYELAEWAERQSNLRILYLIIQEHKQRVGKVTKAIRYIRKRGLIEFVSQISFMTITKIENLILRLSSSPLYKDLREEFNLKQLISQSISIKPQVSKNGFVYRYSDEDINKLKSLNLDLFIRCGSGILRGEILNSSKLGIISFHHGDNRINRGGPAGFWEVYLKQDTTGFIIQRLTEELDGGEVLIRGDFKTELYYLKNQAILQNRSHFYLMNLLSEIADKRRLPPIEEPQPYFNRLYKRPGMRIQFIYMLKLVFRITHKSITRLLLKKDYRWGVAFSRGCWKNLVMWRSTKLEVPPNHFLADPFVITEGNHDFCFVEDYDYEAGKACIAVYELKDKISERVGVAIAEPFHLSYPYMFKYESKLYMCPETSTHMDIRLYECSEFPLKWKLSQILMDNVSAYDSMIFEKGGMWWLFTNINPVGVSNCCLELSIFYADNPLSKKWTPHPQNPVVIGASKARNGGFLADETSIYRVSQKQGFDMYGKGLSINKICLLNQNEYVENELCSVEPNFFPNISGTHHMHSNGSVTVFDFAEISGRS